MLYWDSSAVVSFILGETTANQVRDFLRTCPAMPSYSAIITMLEVESAIQRRLNERSITFQQAIQARIELVQFHARTILIPTDEKVLEIAMHCQRIYGLRAGDAIQLASARVAVQKSAQTQFLCLDKRLNQAAMQEAFNVCLGYVG